MWMSLLLLGLIATPGFLPALEILGIQEPSPDSSQYKDGELFPPTGWFDQAATGNFEGVENWLQSITAEGSDVSTQQRRQWVEQLIGDQRLNRPAARKVMELALRTSDPFLRLTAVRVGWERRLRNRGAMAEIHSKLLQELTDPVAKEHACLELMAIGPAAQSLSPIVRSWYEQENNKSLQQQAALAMVAVDPAQAEDAMALLEDSLEKSLNYSRQRCDLLRSIRNLKEGSDLFLPSLQRLQDRNKERLVVVAALTVLEIVPPENQRNEAQQKAATGACKTLNKFFADRVSAFIPDSELEVLAKHGPAVLPQIIQSLKVQNNRPLTVTRRAMQGLQQMGPQAKSAIPVLKQRMVHSKSEGERKRIAETLLVIDPRLDAA